MRILVAGATGAIGKPLLELLVNDSHVVFGITHSEERALEIAGRGANPLHLNVLDKKAVFEAVENIRPQVVINMLTSLPKEYRPEAMEKASEFDRRLRSEGGGYLQEAAEKFGAERYILQSSAFWYEQGQGLADETTPFAFNATPAIASGTKLYAEIEKRALESNQIEGIVLRFGFFYGPGTWFHTSGDMAVQVRQKKMPIIGKGEGLWNFIHIVDAAKACAEALYIKRGAYNIVNNHPIVQREWLPAFCRYVEAPFPPSMTEEEALIKFGADSVYYATKLRGASNIKAKQAFNFAPRPLTWLL